MMERIHVSTCADVIFSTTEVSRKNIGLQQQIISKNIVFKLILSTQCSWEKTVVKKKLICVLSTHLKLLNIWHFLLANVWE